MGLCTSCLKPKGFVTLRCCRCLKDQTVEYHGLLCPECKNRVAEHKICQKCSQDYLALFVYRQFNDSFTLDNPLRCSTCREYYDCQICGTESFKKICDDCFHNQPRCVCCRHRFKDRFESVRGERYCKTCAVRTKRIIGDQALHTQKVKIKYQWKMFGHKIPCKSATERYNYITKTGTCERIFPMVSPEFDPQKYELPNKICSKYCYGRTSYKIISHEIL